MTIALRFTCCLWLNLLFILGLLVLLIGVCITVLGCFILECCGLDFLYDFNLNCGGLRYWFDCWLDMWVFWQAYYLLIVGLMNLFLWVLILFVYFVVYIYLLCCWFMLFWINLWVLFWCLQWILFWVFGVATLVALIY